MRRVTAAPPPHSANTAEKGAGRVQDRNHFTHFHKKHVRKNIYLRSDFFLELYLLGFFFVFFHDF